MVKKVVFRILMLILPLIMLIIGGEIVLRVYHYFKPLVTHNSVKSIISDDLVGWKTAPNFKFHGYLYDIGGKKYEVDIKTNQYGFRTFGEINTNKKKYLFLGDSFTHAQQVSNDKTYYGILQKKGLGEIFAYGTNGFSTLQEFMILDQFIDIIEPDVIVLQYCSNDLINNSYQLESRSSLNNPGKRKPYLNLEGDIVYANPSTYFSKIRDFITHYSYFLNSVFWRIDKLYAAINKTTTIEQVIHHSNGDLPLFKNAISITDKILKRITGLSSSHTPVYAFSVDNSAPYYEVLKTLSTQNNIHFIDGIPRALRNAERKGIVIKATDNIHWNGAGHAIVASELERHFIKLQ